MTTTSDCEYFWYRVSVPTMIRLLFFPVQIYDHQDAEPALPARGMYQGDDHQLHGDHGRARATAARPSGESRAARY